MLFDVDRKCRRINSPTSLQAPTAVSKQALVSVFFIERWLQSLRPGRYRKFGPKIEENPE